MTTKLCPVELLQEGARQLGLPLQEEQIRQLTTYLDALLFWSTRIDLVSQRDPSVIVRKHFLDTLAVARLLPDAATLLDLGSGAGFPGVPLAVLCPQMQVSLLETRRKRVSFLREVKRTLRAQNLSIYEGRAEELAQTAELRGAFDLVITRATWSLPTFLALAAPFLRDQGLAVAMQGPSSGEKVPETVAVGQETPFRLIARHEYRLPFGDERRWLTSFAKDTGA